MFNYLFNRQYIQSTIQTHKQLKQQEGASKQYNQHLEKSTACARTVGDMYSKCSTGWTNTRRNHLQVHLADSYSTKWLACPADRLVTAREPLLVSFPPSLFIAQPNQVRWMEGIQCLPYLGTLRAACSWRAKAGFLARRTRISCPRICHATLTLIKLSPRSAAVLQCIA